MRQIGDRRRILIPVFIAILVVCPMAIYAVGIHYRHAGFPLGLAAVTFIIGCAVVLRSTVIAGALAGTLVAALVEFSAVNAPLPEIRDAIPVALATIIGALLGEAWHEALDARALSEQSKRGTPSRR